MRFSYLVAAEFFFSSLICIGIGGCLSFEDIKNELTTFFSKEGNIMEYDDFKCRKDSPSGLLLNANIDIHGEINPEYKLLLCLEEFMYAFRSFFEDRIKGGADQQNLFDSFCRYVAEKIKSDNINFDNNSPDAKIKKACDVLFLNLCKLFFIDKEKDVYGDVRYFSFIFKLLHNGQKQIQECLKTFISQVYERLGQFVGAEKEKLKKGEFDGLRTPELLKIYDGQHSSPETIVQSLFFHTCESICNDDKPLPTGNRNAEEIFYFENSSTSGKLMHKKKGEGYVVLIYDDFVVFENTKSKEEIVWKREPKNKATPYSFYRKLSKEQILEIDILAKDPKKKVINVLEEEIKEQMLYDAEQLCRQIKDFVGCFIDQQRMWQNLLAYCERKVSENFKEGNRLIKNSVGKNECLFAFFEEYFGKICKKELTEDLWNFSIEIRKCFLDGIKENFGKLSKSFYSEYIWFKGLANVGNSCYINALSQNLFDYKEEMRGMVNGTFLKEMGCLQKAGIKGWSRNFVKITGYDGKQQDSHELFAKIFIPKSIEEKEKMMSDATKSIKEVKGYYSFLFCFNSTFECLDAFAIKEEEGENEEMNFKKIFNEDKKKEIKSINDVLNSIYDYLNNYYCNLSLFHTTIDTYCDHDCSRKYSIKITNSSEIEVDSCEVYNGLDLSSLIKKKVKEKISVDCSYLHLKKNVDIYREQTYHNFSDFLVICLKRYTSPNKSISNSIPIPDNIFFDGNGYNITGIVCHFGDFSSGHYIAYKKKFGLWFKFDDSTVSVVGPSLPKEVVKCAYMLFFKKNKEIKANNKIISERDTIEGNSQIESEEEEEKKKQEEEAKKKQTFFPKLLRYYSIFNERYFGNKNKEGKTFVDYLQDIVKDKKDTKTLLEDFLKNKNKNNDDLEKQFNAFLLLQVQNYCKLSEGIKVIDRDSKDINEIHVEKLKMEKELGKVENNIIMLICEDLDLNSFFKKRSTNSFLKKFVKVFFISFCDFDNTCEKPLFKEDTLQALKKGEVEFFFRKDKNINIPDNRDLPFFLITPTTIKDQQNDVLEDNFEEKGETMAACAEDGKYYCFWSDKLIIAQEPKNVKDKSQSNIDKNEINEGDKISIYNHNNIDAAYDSFENCAMFKKTFEVCEGGFFERLSDEECSKYFIKNIVKDVQEEREKKLDLLLSFIRKIKDHFTDFIEKTKKEIEECQKKIGSKDQDFFRGKQDEIKKQYVQQIEDLDKSIAIANECYKKVVQDKEKLTKKQDENDKKINEVSARIINIEKRLEEQEAQLNSQGDETKIKSKAQVFGEKNKGSIQTGDDTCGLEELRGEMNALWVKKKSIEKSMRQVNNEGSPIAKLIKKLKKKKKKKNGVVDNNNTDIDFVEYKKRLETYSDYKETIGEILPVLSDLEEDINAVLTRNKEHVLKSLAIKNINFDDIIKSLDNCIFDLFVSEIEGEIINIIYKNLIYDLYEYLCFGVKTSKRVLVGSEQRFKGLKNLGNTCYINSILQNLVEFKDDLLIIKDLPKDEKFTLAQKTIRDTVFEVLGEEGSDPRIGLHNVLNISNAKGLGDIGDPADVYSSLLNYYINQSYSIEVVKSEEEKEFIYKSNEGNKIKMDNGRYCNAKLILPLEKGEYKEIKDTDIIKYLYSNDDFKKDIKKHIPVSQGPFVFHNMIKRKYCEECKKKEITIEIECSPFCLVYQQLKDGKISDVVKGSFDTVTEEDEKDGIDCDSCKQKIAKVKRSSCYRVMNNCLCFQFIYKIRHGNNFIDIEDEVKVGDEVYESVCACYYGTFHYIAFKKINDIWFKFDDNVVSPTIYKSLPKMYKGTKPTLVFYKKKIKNKKINIKN